VQAQERTSQEERRLVEVKAAAESRVQEEEELELQKCCANSLCMACELCMWTATDWAQRYKAIRQLPMEERGQRVEAYRKEEHDYLVWQGQQDGGKLPWVTSSFTVTCTHGCKIGFTQAELVKY
jgi:hypothetical protein